MNQDEFEEKYNSLSSNDMSKVSGAIYNMENEFLAEDMPEGCSACGNPAYPDCKLGCNMFDD